MIFFIKYVNRKKQWKGGIGWRTGMRMRAVWVGKKKAAALAKEMLKGADILQKEAAAQYNWEHLH
jgi:hypothetical protein